MALLSPVLILQLSRVPAQPAPMTCRVGQQTTPGCFSHPLKYLRECPDNAEVPARRQRGPTGDAPEPKRPKGDDASRGTGLPGGSAVGEIQVPIAPLPPPCRGRYADVPVARSRPRHSSTSQRSQRSSPAPSALSAASRLSVAVMCWARGPDCLANADGRCPGKAGTCERPACGSCSKVCPHCSVSY